jgi:hypothetical protein
LTRLDDKAKNQAMIRSLVGLALCAAACGRAQGVSDEDLGGLVVATKPEATAIDVERAAKEPGELGRALMEPYKTAVTALGPHELAIDTQTTVDEGGKQVWDLADKTRLVLGEAGAYHATYENSADYGREVIFTANKLYLRPRYQRWHGRAPETPDEPAQMRDQIVDAIGATWDLVAPGAELTDRGTVSVDGRNGRKIEVALSPHPQSPPAEPLSQRKWREGRTITALSGEVVLDAERGVPLTVQIAATIGYTRDGKRETMKLTLASKASSIGKPGEVLAPATDVVATPERQREVDDRDTLLQGIAPPLRKGADTAAAPAEVKKPPPLGPKKKKKKIEKPEAP